MGEAVPGLQVGLTGVDADDEIIVVELGTEDTPGPGPG